MSEMLIDHYIPFFHDGAVINIEHLNTSIEISMQSAQMHKEDLIDEIKLSKHHRIKGKLHLDGIQDILMNGVHHLGKLKMDYDKGGIFDFILKNNLIELQIEWVNFPPKPDVTDFSVIIIQADHIWWENIPDLYDPLW
ncbi:MAG: hypothetical protein KAR79_05860 [Simkaniaceae bacterium]|nr:hypothetical protein [Simkaniaceae bacterium]